jgi:hypothetical protein
VPEKRAALAPSVSALRHDFLDDVIALEKFVETWNLALEPTMAAQCEELAARGFAFLALVYGGPGGAAATRTVRITDDTFPAVPLSLTATTGDPVPVTTYVFADSRTRLGPGAEMEVDGSGIVVGQNGRTNYAAELRSSLLDARGASWAIESAGHDLLFDGAHGPAGVDPTPDLASTYLRLAAAGDHFDTSDLPLAFIGLDPTSVWLTRMSGIVPPGTQGDDLAVTRRDAVPKSPFFALPKSAVACPRPDAGGGGPGGPPGGGTGEPIPPPSTGRPPPSHPPTVDPPSTPPPAAQPGPSVGLSCACSPGPGGPPPETDESCDGSDPGAPSDHDACDGAPEDDSDESRDGSAGDDSGSDSCDGDAPASDSDDSCGGGPSDASDGCSSGSSSDHGSDNCSAAPESRRSKRSLRVKGVRVRASVMTLTFAALALALRRATKRRERVSAALAPAPASDWESDHR